MGSRTAAVNRQIRIVTYNIHKCRGLDRRTRPLRIASILRATNADVIALQEVIGENELSRGQAEEIATALSGYYSVYFGENRRLRGAAYGNAVLSRFPALFAKNYDLTWARRERRGCLRVDVAWEGVLLHIFNVHLGTGFLERRRQVRMLLSDSLLRRIDLQGPSIVVGDFNEWTHGLASKLMKTHYQSVNLRRYLGRSRTYPGLAPLLHLDHFYFDDRLALEHFQVCRTRQALIASDHVPLIADFRLAAARGTGS
ncbi:MAG TPA: endonuclease/exonuclease/phosphatase family protein [Terriglobales bacterium]|nr:endonuclease/exonuclease/phosphatase family protein [Terriglobales bacterium]